MLLEYDYCNRIIKFLKANDVFNNDNFISIRMEIVEAILDASDHQKMEKLDEVILTKEEMEEVYG